MSRRMWSRCIASLVLTSLFVVAGNSAASEFDRWTFSDLRQAFERPERAKSFRELSAQGIEEVNVAMPAEKGACLIFRSAAGNYVKALCSYRPVDKSNRVGPQTLWISKAVAYGADGTLLYQRQNIQVPPTHTFDLDTGKSIAQGGDLWNQARGSGGIENTYVRATSGAAMLAVLQPLLERPEPKPDSGIGEAINLSLSAYLHDNPRVRKAIRLQVEHPTNQFATWTPYDQWPSRWQARLEQIYVAYMNDEALPIAPPLPTAPRSEMRDNSRIGYRSAEVARDAYFAQVAHCLWLDISRELPWKLKDWSDSELSSLLSSHVIFSCERVPPANNFRYVVYVGQDSEATENILHDPRSALKFLKVDPEDGRQLIGKTPSETAYKLSEWIHDYLHPAPDIDIQRFHHDKPLLTDRLRRQTHPDGTQVYFTSGGHGASSLFVDLMRSVNIPVLKFKNAIVNAAGQEEFHWGLNFNWHSKGNAARFLVKTEDLFMGPYFVDPAPAPKGTERGVALWNHVWLDALQHSTVTSDHPSQFVWSSVTDDQYRKYREMGDWLVSSPRALVAARSLRTRAALVAALKRDYGFSDAEAAACWSAVEASAKAYGDGDVQVGYERLLDGPSSRHEHWKGRTGRAMPFALAVDLAADDRPDAPPKDKPAPEKKPAPPTDKPAPEKKPAPPKDKPAPPKDRPDTSSVVAKLKKLGAQVSLDGEGRVSWLRLNADTTNDASLADLKGFTHLQLLDLRRAKVTDAGLQQLSGLSRLTSLTIGETQITDDGLKSLRSLDQLRSLDLMRTAVTDAGLEHVKQLSGLEKLFLDGTQVSDAGLAVVGELENLKTLWISYSGITDAGLAHLRGLKQLDTLWISRTKITDAGLRHLAELSQLQSLRLDETKVTDAGLKHLRGLSQLETLFVASTEVEGHGLANLSDLPNLKSLHVDGTKLTGKGMQHVGKLMKLKWLFAANNNIDDAGLAHLKDMKELERVSIHCNSRITDAGLDHLAAIATLKEVEVQGAKVTQAGVDRLKQARPNCKVEHEW